MARLESETRTAASSMRRWEGEPGPQRWRWRGGPGRLPFPLMCKGLRFSWLVTISFSRPPLPPPDVSGYPCLGVSPAIHLQGHSWHCPQDFPGQENTVL